MEIGFGVLCLSPSVFWGEYTLPEFMAAIDGYLEANGATAEGEADDLTEEDRADIREMMDRHRTVHDTPENRKKLLARVKREAAEKHARQGKRVETMTHANGTR